MATTTAERRAICMEQGVKRERESEKKVLCHFQVCILTEKKQWGFHFTLGNKNAFKN